MSNPGAGAYPPLRHKTKKLSEVYERTKKVLLSAALVVSAVSSALAQGNGLAGINDATNMVTSYFDPCTKLIYAIGP